MSEFVVIEQLNIKQIRQLYELFQKLWKSENRTMTEILVLLKNSLSFGIIEQETQNLVAYARVLTDDVKYAFIFDVMAIEQHRKKGLGRILMNAIIHHPRLRKIKFFELTCVPGMIPFYEKFEFSEDYGNVKPMRLCRNE